MNEICLLIGQSSSKKGEGDDLLCQRVDWKACEYERNAVQPVVS